MKVKDLRNKLNEFNPEADVRIIDDTWHARDIDFYGWINGNGGDNSSEIERDIEKEKMTCNCVDLCFANVGNAEVED